MLCVHVMGAPLWAPMRSSQTLHTGEEIVIAIQNGQTPTEWYAIQPGVFPFNVATVTHQNGYLINPPSSVRWRVYSSSPLKLQQGSYNLLNNTAGWRIPLIGSGLQRQFVSTTSDTLIWRTNSAGKGVDYFNRASGDVLVNQIAQGLDLPTGSYAFQIFMRLPTFEFIPGEYGNMNKADCLQSTDVNGNFTFPACVSYSAAHAFVGWGTSPNGPVEHTAGDKIHVSPSAQYNEHTTYYAIYKHVDLPDIPNQCFDFTDLNSRFVKCHYEDNSRVLPGQLFRYEGLQTGLPTSESVHINVIEEDGNMYNKPNSISKIGAKQVPDGFEKAVRLGNYQPNCGSEDVEYTIVVDTTENPILIIKCAPVLEESHKDGAGVKFYVKDAFGNLVDELCTTINFQLEGSTITGSMPGNPEWKKNEGFQYLDWATIGIDLSPYHGRMLVLTFHTWDCAQGEHMGYCYYAMRCEKKEIKAYACANDEGYFRLEAPEGFFYRWYKASDPSIIISTERTIMVPPSSDERVYNCDCSIDNVFNCAFTISATLEYQVPVAQFEAEVKHGSCADTVWITNTSFVSPDGVHELQPHLDCDSALWDFGDGRLADGAVPNPKQYQWNEPIIYKHAGDKTIRLKTCINNWDCLVDSTSFTFHVEAGKDYQIVYDTLCLGETFTFANQRFTATQPGDTTIICPLTDACLTEGTLEEHIHVGATYEIVDTVYLCGTQSYTWRGRSFVIPGLYYDSLTIVHLGCDSVYILDLRQATTDSVSIYDTICSNTTYYWDGREYNKAGKYSFTYVNRFGCDSVVTLNLGTLPSYRIDTVVVLCPNQFPYSWHGHSFAQPTVYHENHTSSQGCDSIVTLYLLKDKFCDNPDHPLNPTIDCDTTYSVIDTTFRYNDLQTQPFMWFGKEYTEPGIYTDTLIGANYAACDSIGSLLLRVTYQDSLTACEGEQVTFHTPWGDYNSIPDCDCIYGYPITTEDNEWLVSISLCVQRKDCSCDTIYAEVHQQVKEDELPYSWNDFSLPIVPFNEKRDTTAVFTTPAASGCDSITTLFLHVLGPCELPSTYVPVWWKK